MRKSFGALGALSLVAAGAIAAPAAQATGVAVCIGWQSPDAPSKVKVSQVVASGESYYQANLTAAGFASTGSVATVALPGGKVFTVFPATVGKTSGMLEGSTLSSTSGSGSYSAPVPLYRTTSLTSGAALAVDTVPSTPVVWATWVGRSVAHPSVTDEIWVSHTSDRIHWFSAETGLTTMSAVGAAVHQGELTLSYLAPTSHEVTTADAPLTASGALSGSFTVRHSHLMGASGVSVAAVAETGSGQGVLDLAYLSTSGHVSVAQRVLNNYSSAVTVTDTAGRPQGQPSVIVSGGVHYVSFAIAQSGQSTNRIQLSTSSDGRSFSAAAAPGNGGFVFPGQHPSLASCS
jgi:hypothetical protein